MKITFPATVSKMCLIAFLCNITNMVCVAQKEGAPKKIPRIDMHKEDKFKLVVWVKPGQQSKFDAWRKNFDSVYGEVSSYQKCANCVDNSLMVFSGKGPRVFISGQTATGGSSGIKNASTGEEGPAVVYWSINFPVDLKDTVRSKGNKVQKKFPLDKPSTENPVTVAVFDTGVDPEKNTSLTDYYFYINPNHACLGTNDNNGWNFIRNDETWKNDDVHSLHGTVVTSLIKDQGAQYHQQIKILPVKIHDNNGESNLFKVLCGLAYAVNRGADIINASFGYYASKKDKAPLLKEFIKFYLDNNDRHILLIAAAGNRDDENESKVYSAASFTDPVNENPYRNLENVNFYPASLSNELRNVISVTTVSEQSNRVCPFQNYAEKAVDIGVAADGIEDLVTYFFIHPFLEGNHTVVGSSFATPVASGKIAGMYASMAVRIRSGDYTKEQIIENLISAEKAHHNPEFDRYIRNGTVMIK